MSGHIAGPVASKTTGTFVLANNTVEQTILDIPNADRVVQDVSVRLNVTALTKNNAEAAPRDIPYSYVGAR